MDFSRCRKGALSLILVALLLFLLPQNIFSSEQKVVRVGYVNAENYEEGGEGEYKRGFGYEYFQKISYITGWKYEYVYGSFSECLQMLVDGQIDLFGNVTYSPERAQQFLFSTYPEGKDTYFLYASNNREDLVSNNLSRLNGARIGVTRSSFQEGLISEWLSSNCISAIVVPCSGFDELMSYMDSGYLDCIVAPDLSTSYGYKIITGIGSSDYYFAVSKQRPDILEELNSALFEIQNTQTDYNSILAAKYYYKMASGLTMNEDEKAWLEENNNTIRLGFLSDYLPFVGESDGKVTGVMSILIESLKRDYSVNVECHFYENLSKLVEALESDKVDLIGPVVGDFYLAETLNHVLTEPVIETTPVLIYKEGSDFSDSINVIATTNQSVFSKSVVNALFPSSTAVNYETADDCLRAIASGSAGSLVIPSSRINIVKANNLMKDMVVAEMSHRTDLNLLATKENRRAASILNKAINHSRIEMNGMVLSENSISQPKIKFGDFVKQNAWHFVIGLVLIVLILSYQSYKLHKNKKEITSALSEAKEAKAIVEKNNILLKDQLDIIQSVSKVFYCLYYIDMKDFSFVELGTTVTRISSIIGKKGSAKAAFEEMTKNLVLKEFSQAISEFTDLDSLNERLRNQNWVSCQFCGPISGWSEGMFIAADRDPNGDCNHVIWGVRGINEQKEKELEQERLLELRVKTMSEAIHGGFKIGKSDKQFSFIMVSEQFANLLGYSSPEELIQMSGGSMAGLVNQEDMQREMTEAMDAVSRGEMYTMRYRLRCKNGSWKNVEDRGRLISNGKGEQEFWSFIVDQDQIAQLENANKAKSNFLFNMSHDIRTPMNAILGYSQLMKKELTDPKLLDYQSKIEQSGNLLLSIINNVLDMARIESGKTELNEEFLDTEEVIKEIMSVFGEEARKKGIAITYDWEPSSHHLFVDQTKIKEIFLNLISNAVKYTPEGGSIHIASQSLPCTREGYVKIMTTVEDTGIGMSREYLPHVFDSFTRERSATTSKIGGTGLGMPIVKKLVELMGGTIEVESELGKGTKFTLILEHRIADESYFVQKKVATEHEKKDILQGKRFLLAEDNDLNAEIAIAILEDMGITVDRVEDGIECVARVEKEKEGYDLILMDIHMPNMDGYKAAQSIRLLKDPKKSSIPIIAMTANAFEEDRRNALEAGMNGHIAKPIDVSKMEEAIIAALLEAKH